MVGYLVREARSGLRQTEHRIGADLERLDVPGAGVVRGLKMKMNRRIHGGEDSSMRGRVETDNGRFC